MMFTLCPDNNNNSILYKKNQKVHLQIKSTSNSSSLQTKIYLENIAFPFYQLLSERERVPYFKGKMSESCSW